MLSPPPAQQPATGLSRSGLLFWLLFLGMLLVGSSQRSLWADEFHSLHHAQSSGLSTLLASVRTDNHPPLSFLLEHLSIALFGNAEWALRLPSVLTGIVFFGLLRRHLSILAPWAEASRGPWVVLASSYYFVIFSEARMYALLALASLGLMITLAGILGDEKRAPSRWFLTLWICVGLHSHYYFIHELLLSAVFLCVVWGLHPRLRKKFRALLLPVLMGCLLFVPWACYGLLHQLQGDLPPGRAAGNLSALRDGFAHMFHWNASLAGPWAVHYVAIPGTLLAAIACLSGGLNLVKRARSLDHGGLQALLLLCYGVGLPVLTWVVSRFSERSTFGWRYLSGAAIAVLLIATVGLAGTSRWRRALSGLLLLTMGTITLVNVQSGGHEDHRKLFAHLLAHGLPTDAILDKPPYDPLPVPGESSWAYYVQRMNQAGNPTLPREYAYDEISLAQQNDRVWVWLRDQYHPWIRRTLRQSHAVVEQWSMGPAMTLYLFSKPSPSPTQ